MMCQIFSLSNEGLDVPVLLDLKEHFELFPFNPIRNRQWELSLPYSHCPCWPPKVSLIDSQVLGAGSIRWAEKILKYRCL